MPALLDLVPIDEIGQRSFDPLARGGQNFLGERARAGRDGHLPIAEIGKAFPIQPRGRSAGRRQPVQHHVVDHLVHRERIPWRTVIVGPVEDFLEDPRGQRHRGIHQGIADGLRPRALLLGIARIPLLVETETFERFENVRILAVHVVGTGPSDRHVEMNTATAFRCELADRRGHRGAPVTPLCQPLCVTEAGHQFRPCPGDPLDAPARVRGLVRKAVARQRGRDDVERHGVGVLGFDQIVYHPEEFDHRTGPAMR